MEVELQGEQIPGPGPSTRVTAAVVDKEHGAAGEHTGKRRGGGCGRRGGLTTTRPRAEDEMLLLDISELPVGVALERPLRPKYRRGRNRSPSTSLTRASSLCTAMEVELHGELIPKQSPPTRVKGVIVNKERGAAGEPTGRRGRRGGFTTTRPRAEDEMCLLDISELPVGVALERPLGSKNRRGSGRSPSTSVTQAASLCTAMEVELQGEQIAEPRPSTRVTAAVSDKEHSAAGEHTGKRRGGGCGRRSGLTTTRPQAEDEMFLLDISELPVGVSLERPLRPKHRRGRNRSPSTSPTRATSLCTAMEVELLGELIPKQSPSSRVTGAVVDKEHGAAGEHTGKRRGGGCGRRGGLTTTRLRAEDESAELETSCPDGNSQRRRLPPTSLNGDGNVFQIDYGSEEEESDSEDEAAPFIPRAHQVHMEDTPEDETAGTEAEAVPVIPAADPDAGLVKPNDMYDFVWKSFPTPSVTPALRRETFSVSKVGPTTPCVDPYDIFVAIWDRQVMEHIASETNRYAQEVALQLLINNRLCPSSRINNWQDTSVDELYVFFAIMLGMGLVVKFHMDDYWSVNPRLLITPGFGTYMSLNRFKLIAKCLHFNNNRNMCVQKLSSSEAKLFKISPVLSHLNSKFQSMYQPGQNIALDESLLRWMGRLKMNPFIPNDSVAVGIKTYEVCDAQTGYLWRFEIHAHRKGTTQQQLEDPLAAPVPAVVQRLTHGLENKGHTLWMDNYYNSPALSRKLKTLGFDSAGTLRTNRQFVPEELSKLTNENMRVGQITGCTSGDVDLMVWRDTNRVAMISTYHGNATVNVNGTLKPALICDYNVMMRGMDKKNRILAMFPIERKYTRVWYKQFFRRLLNVSVLNSFIIHKASSPSSSALTHREFRIKLINSLLQRHSSAVAPTPQIRPRVTYRGHCLAKNPKSSGGTERSRLTCYGCKKRVGLYCVGCNKPCCLACFPIKHHLV